MIVSLLELMWFSIGVLFLLSLSPSVEPCIEDGGASRWKKARTLNSMKDC